MNWPKKIGMLIVHANYPVLAKINLGIYLCNKLLGERMIIFSVLAQTKTKRKKQSDGAQRQLNSYKVIKGNT